MVEADNVVTDLTLCSEFLIDGEFPIACVASVSEGLYLPFEAFFAFWPRENCQKAKNGSNGRKKPTETLAT